jgi:preprotein translocase subunit SecG
VHGAITAVTSVVWVISCFSMIGGILLHSGRGGGLSDMFGGGGGAGLGSTAAERNLNRITMVLASVWVFATIGLGLLLT